MRSVFVLVLLFLISCNGQIESLDKPIIKIEPIVEFNSPIDIQKLIEEPRDDKFLKEFENQKETIARLMVDIQKLKKSVKTKAIIKQPIVRKKTKTTIKALLKDKLFKHVGHYGHGTKCRGKIYRKDFKRSWLYLHVDCKGNYTKQQIRRR